MDTQGTSTRNKTLSMEESLEIPKWHFRMSNIMIEIDSEQKQITQY